MFTPDAYRGPGNCLLRPSLAAVVLALALSGCNRMHALVGQAQSVETGPTTITIGPEVLHTSVKRLGINLSGQTFYDSGQMLRNLTFRNPGFEGETWQSILHCKSVAPLSCTDENQYAQWPDGFLNGARYEVLSGVARGAIGTVQTSQAAAGDHGVTLHLDSAARALAAGDFLLVRAEKPGGAEAGWWKDLKGGATLLTEFKDLAPNTAGRQALRIEAAGPGQSATVSSFFDSYGGRSFVQMRGAYTLRFRARAVAGKPEVKVELKRLDSAHGLHNFLEKTVALSPAWRDYTFPFEAQENGSAVGTVGLSFAFEGSTALLDDVSLEATPAPANPTAFRNEVVDTLRALRPGVLRYMDNGTNFGSSLDNMLAVPFARQRSGASEQEVLHEDIPLGLHEFLTLCAAIGAEPWYSMPPGTSSAEAQHLAEYLGGAADTQYGALRARLGQRSPWTSVFRTIHLELGNEQWNSRSFAGSTINDPKVYGQRASQIFAALRVSPAYRDSSYDLILGTWATVPWWTGEELSASTAHDSIAVAPYLFSEFNDTSSTEAVFGPMFAEPEMLDSRPGGIMAQQLAVAKAARRPAALAVYETNLGTMSGTASQQALDNTVPSLGAGLAVADHMLLMLRDLGITTQCLFALPEYINGFSTTGGPKEDVPLWGAVVDMGGATNLRRPQFLAEQLANEAILPTMLATHMGGAQQVWDQPLSTNGKVQLPGAHFLQTFAFAEGTQRSLILLNLSRDRSLPVLFRGEGAPGGKVTRAVLTAPAITSNNEHTEQVSIHREVLGSFDTKAPCRLPPFSMTILTWTAAPASR